MTFAVILLVFNMGAGNAAPIPLAGFDKLQDCEDAAAQLKKDPEFPKNLLPVCYVKPVRA